MKPRRWLYRVYDPTTGRTVHRIRSGTDWAKRRIRGYRKAGFIVEAY